MSLLSMRCPFCGVYTQISHAYVDHVAAGVNIGQPVRAVARVKDQHCWIGTCSNPGCGRPVMVLGSAQQIYPVPQPVPSDERIPEHVRRDLDEAKRCGTVGAWRATLTMARRAMQAACLFKGADEGKPLVAEIDQLATMGIITNDLKDWAHEVRHLGNDGAHPPKEHTQDVVTKEDAEDALELAEAFLGVVFVTPALAAERKAKRTSAP